VSEVTQALTFDQVNVILSCGKTSIEDWQDRREETLPFSSPGPLYRRVGNTLLLTPVRGSISGDRSVGVLSTSIVCYIITNTVSTGSKIKCADDSFAPFPTPFDLICIF